MPTLYRFAPVLVCVVASFSFASARADDAKLTVRVWPGDPPEWTAPTGKEGDTSDPRSRQVAGRRVIRLGNVSTPELHLFPAENANTTIIICPGGGFTILAWDLEGTEIAEWLQKHGVSVAVLKYRVPTQDEEKKWVPPVQDLQRSISLVRSGSVPGMPTKNVGVMGFSAGGHTATRAALLTERLYDSVDEHDKVSATPDFAALVYTAYLTESRKSYKLSPELKVTDQTPPMFFAHAFDDNITCMGSVALFAELKRNNVPSSLHVFSSGGHGFGARDTGNEKDQWLPLFKSWLTDRGF